MNIWAREMSFAVAGTRDDDVTTEDRPLLSRGALHEFYADRQADSVSLVALAMMLGEAAGCARTLWVRHDVLAHRTGEPYAAGIAELGFEPASMLLVQARNALCALQAGLEGARCAALNAVIVEIWGTAAVYDLTASRRLSLVARTSGARILLLRVDASVAASAADTRWRVRASPSRALPAKSPGPPAFHLALLRARNGREGLEYHLEWDRDARRFMSRARADVRETAVHPASLSGAVAPLSFDRAGAAGPLRQAG